ncbi:MAG TPA: DUF11 domain-containing protein, partial [Candidatus Limivivens merdigallinarum]|nr:DUF11 domain-containing protein [Candidatus Limivivens merdigallinarum]
SVANVVTSDKDDDEEDIPLTDPNPSLTIEKAVAAEESKVEYEIGDVIHYEIKVTNNGNITLNNVVVTDEMNTSDGEGTAVITRVTVDGTVLDGVINGTVVTIPSLAPYKVAVITCEYTVRKADRDTTVTNRATATSDETPDPEETETPGEKVKEVYDIFVKHAFADAETGDPSILPADYTYTENKEPDYTATITAGDVEGYTAFPATRDVKIVDSDITITFYYYKDTIGTDPENPDTGDGVPDKYQITFTYTAAENGTVTGTLKEVHTIYEYTINADGTVTVDTDLVPAYPRADATPTPDAGYAFDYWTIDGTTKDYTATMDHLKAEGYLEDTTFTAYFDTDTKGGGDDAEESDNIPDKYQVIFRYVSADTTMGTVTGEPTALVEVRTLTTPAGGYLEAASNPVSPRAEVTVNAAAGNSFVYWTDGTATDYSASLATIKTMTYSTDTTFTAYFSTNGTITVTKLLTVMDGMDEIPMASTEGLTYHFGLFTDAEGTTLLGEEYVKEVTMQNTSSAQLVFENVPDGTYYVFETDANGNALAYDTAQGSGTDSYVPVLNGPTSAVTIDLAAGTSTGQISVTNRYYMDPGGQYYIDAELNITKNVLDGGRTINPDQTFYAGVFTMNEDGTYQLLEGQVIALSSNGTVTTNVPLGGEYGTDEITYYVFETDAQGNILVSGDEAFGYDITGGGAVTLSQENFRETVEITNTVMDDGEEPNTEEPDTEEPDTEEPDTEPDTQESTETEKVTDTVKTNSVKTGDDTNIAIYLVVLIMAGYVLVVAKRRRQK